MKSRMWCIVFSLLLGASNAAAAGRESKPARLQGPKAAVSWGYLLPGAGHLHAGELGKWLLVMGTNLGALTRPEKLRRREIS